MENSNEGGGFVYIETFHPEVTIANREEEFALEEATVTTLLIVEDLENEDTFKVLSRESADLSLSAGESKTLEGKESETKYATIRAYGARYTGHTVIVQNASGKVIATDGSSGWNKNPESALEAEEGSVVREEYEAEE